MTTDLSVCSLSSSNSTLILDSGASVSVVSPQLYSHLHNIRRPTSPKVATAADGHNLCISAEGELGPLSCVLISDNICHNCISVSQLCDQGYTITFTNSNVQVTNSSEKFTGERSGGLYTLPVHTFHSLPSMSTENILNIGSTVPDIDVLDLWHRRLADTSHRIIRESVLIEGIALDRIIYVIIAFLYHNYVIKVTL